MANDRNSGRVLRFGLEAGAIFLGVTLGFLADDYRDYLNDRSLETESLQQIIDDLRVDDEDMAPMVSQTQAIAEMARWITNRAALGSLPADSLRMAVDSLNATSVFWYEPAATAYSGLKSTGRIDLIQDPTLKNAILHYFEDRQPVILTLNVVWHDSARRWWDRAAGHIDVLETDITQEYPNIRVVDADLFVADRRLMFSAGDLSGTSLDLQTYVLEARALNAELATTVRDYLASR
jgi:hypothetical protein